MQKDKKRRAAILVASAFVFPWTATWASSDLSEAPQNRQEVIDRFKAADKNADGKVTKEEAREGMPRVYRVWNDLDDDKKGYITLDQLLEVLKLKD